MKNLNFRAWYKTKKIMFNCFAISSDGELLMTTAKRFAPHKDYNNENCVIMQFTGLKDKNGKDVYEGDIIKHGNNAYEPFVNDISQVYWFENNHAFYFKKKHNKKNENDQQVWDSERLGNVSGGLADRFEVIGNIFENPELLNQ